MPLCIYKTNLTINVVRVDSGIFDSQVKTAIWDELLTYSVKEDGKEINQVFKSISKIMIYKKKYILKNNMVSVKAAKKYFDFLLYLFSKRGYIQNKRQNIWDRKKDLTTSKTAEDDACV